MLVSHIEANYERGLSADILGCGTINDMRKKIVIEKSTRIVVRKDYYPCGSVYLAVGPQRSSGGRRRRPLSETHQAALFFKVRVNGRDRIVDNYGRIEVIKGDTLELVDVIGGHGDPADMVVNFKGFVGNRRQQYR